MSEAIKPTPGPWSVCEHSWCDTSISAPSTDHAICRLDINHATEESQEADEAQMAANARLIAEAGTVHHETGLTPRQLVERVKELEGALGEYMSAFGQALEAHGIQFAQQQVIADELARAALSNALPNAAAKEAGR